MQVTHKRCGFNPRVGKIPGEGHGNPFQYSCLENLMERGAWWTTVSRVAKSRTLLKWLSTHRKLYLEHILFSINCSWMIVPNISLPFLQLPHRKKKKNNKTETIWLIMMLDMVFDFTIILCLIQDLEIWKNNMHRRV